MLLYFCEVFYNKRLTLKVLLTPNSDIAISFDLFRSCSLVRMVSNMFGFQYVGLDYPILDRTRFYFIKSELHCGRFAALRNSSINLSVIFHKSESSH